LIKFKSTFSTNIFLTVRVSLDYFFEVKQFSKFIISAYLVQIQRQRQKQKNSDPFVTKIHGDLRYHIISAKIWQSASRTTIRNFLFVIVLNFCTRTIMRNYKNTKF